MIRSNAFLFIASLALLAGCSKTSHDAKRRGAPPPPASQASAPAVCASGGLAIKDPALARIFPRSAAPFCVDPNAEVRVYGRQSSKPLDAICTEAFDGECEIYKRFGLTRVALLRYTDGSGSGSHVDVVMSQYATEDGAYGMFTKRVVSDGDPARADGPKPMKLDGIGALGTGSAYIWRGKLFIELTFTNDRLPPKKLFAASDAALPKLCAQIAKRLPGPITLPKAAALLPTEHLLPLGVRYMPKDAFDVQGAGAGAIGYYRDGARRYRVLSIPRQDSAQAKDVLGTIAHRSGAKTLKVPVEGTVRVMVGEAGISGRAEWLVAKRDTVVLGVGDEPRALAAVKSPEEASGVSLTRDDKVKLLRQLLTKLPR